MPSDENNVREFAAQHGCSVWANGKGAYRLERDLWGALVNGNGTLDEIEKCLKFGIEFHHSQVGVERYHAKQKAQRYAAEAKQKCRKRVARPPASATKRKSGAARKRKKS
jgi:hypothetical protein